MHISELVFKKRKIFYFLLIALLAGGVFSFQKLSKLEDPEITIMMANVVTVYPGASAHDVEMQVTNVLEKEFATLADLNRVSSRSEANVSIVTVELKMTVPQEEIPQRWEFLRRKIEQALPKLPAGVQDPMVFDDVGDVYGMFYAMIADKGFSYKEMSDYAGLIEKNMHEVKGVKKVSLFGEQKEEIFISLSADKMSEMGIMPIQLFMAINNSTGELYAGNMHSGDQQFRISIDNKAVSEEDLGNILISGLNGASFRLGDLATIKKAYNEPLRNTLFVNNQKAIGIGISMESGENIIKVGERVEKKMEELKTGIPSGISFEKVFFQPERVNGSIHDFLRNLILSVLIVIVVLMFTMGFRGGVIIGSGLILTILATFPFLLVLDGTLQRISLGAFIVAMGMLVDNAIVVLDGILIERKKGNRGQGAYTFTAKRTAIPLLGATLIAIAAFFPVYLSPDTAGTYVRDLFLVLAISLAISWILALTHVPLFSAIFLKKNKQEPKSDRIIYDKPIYRIVRKVLNLGMHNRIITISIVVVLLVITMLNFNKVDKSFFPDFNYNQVYIEHTLPKGSSPTMVNKNLKLISDHFNSYDEVDMVVASHGMTPMRYCLVRGMMAENTDNYGELIVNFKDYETMLKMKPVFTEYLRNEFPDAISRIRKYNLSIKTSHTIEAQFTGSDPAVLKRLASEVEEIMIQNQYVDAYTVCNDWEPKTHTLKALYNPIAGNRAMITRGDASNAILAASDGLPIARLYNGESVLPVRFMVRDKDGNRIEDLNNIPVWPGIPNIAGVLNMETLMGLFNGSLSTDELVRETLTAVPLSTVTFGVKLGWEEPVVRRVNGKRTIEAQCEPIEGYNPSTVQNGLNEAVSKINIPEGYSFQWMGESELKTDALKGILSFVPLAAGIIILILLLLFNDYRRPLIVILCLPLAILGIVPGLLISGQPFSFIAIVAVIGLAGMIIKNAVVLLDEIKLRQKESSSTYSAVTDATISRVRPVVMASLTTMLGMIPLLTDPMYAPLAVTIISGLLVGTIVTLFFVPILYSAFYGVRIPETKKQIEIKNDEIE